MTPSLVALVPVLARPQHVKSLVESFRSSLLGENVDTAMLFLANPDDKDEIAELAARKVWYEIVPWENGPRDYVRKMNYGIAATTSDWILLGADDIDFRPGWFRAALNAHIRTGKLVVGTNDLANPLVKAGKHATHPLIHRDYVKQGTIDDPKVLLHPAYCHNAVDVEFIETAISRDQFVFAHDSHVAHRHPTFDRTVRRDATYQKGMQFAVADRQLLLRRRPLWDPTAKPPQRVKQFRTARARPAPIGYWPNR